MLRLTFSGLLVARGKFDSIESTVADVQGIIPLVRTTLEPLSEALARIDRSQLERAFDDLPKFALQVDQLLQLGQNITRQISRYFPIESG